MLELKLAHVSKKAPNIGEESVEDLWNLCCGYHFVRMPAYVI